MMSKWNALVGPHEILAALVVSGFGNGLIFAQLSAIALATVPAGDGQCGEPAGNAAQYEFGFGVSLLTSLLVERPQVISRVWLSTFRSSTPGG